MDLEAIFREYSDRTWFFVRPGGNWGDYLIYAGAESLADRVHLNWKTVSIAELQDMQPTENDCIYLHGAGGFNTWCSGQPFIDLAVATAKHVDLVVQGPATIEQGNARIDQKFSRIFADLACKRFVFFVRELTSQSVIKPIVSKLDRVETAIDDDTALRLTREGLAALAGLPGIPEGRYKLYVDRQDNEAPSASQIKLSLTAVYLDPATEAANFSEWVKIHLYAKEIHTNRLHSAIVGAIAGKKVMLGPGSYHKNQSIWEYSLRKYDVTWEDQEYRVPLFNTFIPSFIKKSFKFRKLIRVILRVPVTFCWRGKIIKVNY